MKKFIITILAVFYLGVSSGATVHLHYCMGKLIDWSFSHEEANECSNCGMEQGNSKNCCKDQHHKLTVKDSPKASIIVYHFNTWGLDIPLTAYKQLADLYIDSTEQDDLYIHSPPRTQATPAFIRNCNFRI